MQASCDGMRLALGGLGAVRGAVALALAGVLAGVLAAALALAIVLALAGVLGQLLLIILRDEQEAGMRRRGCAGVGAAGERLRVETC